MLGLAEWMFSKDWNAGIRQPQGSSRYLSIIKVPTVMFLETRADGHFGHLWMALCMLETHSLTHSLSFGLQSYQVCP